MFLTISLPVCTVTAVLGQVRPTPLVTEPDLISLNVVSVIGTPENLERVPGAGAIIGGAEIRTFGYDDINQVIRRTPGVYFRQEDGYGLFPNLSLRGVSTTRNSKIAIMEDGILMAPAPYSDPAAYYTPNAGRMSGIEILKGSSQIKYGPETTGGVINYLSAPIPNQDVGFLETSLGSNHDLRVHANYGGQAKRGPVTLGFVVENVYRETDGFKKIDATPGGGFTGSNQTGFDRNEPLAKFRLTFSGAIPQVLNLSFGRTEIDAHETYLGLTEADFRATPHRRYAATRFDRITTDQKRLHARYTIDPTEALSLSLTAYRTEFARNWYKLDSAALVTGGFLNLSESLAGQHGSDIIAVLKGESGGRLRVRANNRSYGAKGVELASALRFTTGSLSHRLEAGARWHEDFADRFQWDDVYTQDAAGGAVRTTAGTPGTQENRRAESQALALYLQHHVSVGQLTVSPGLRRETIDYADIRRSTATATLSQITQETSRGVSYLAPGIGATWRPSERLTWLAGAHQGVSPPGPGNALEEEQSLGYEAGLRYRHESSLTLEAIAFHTRFKDLIVEANAGGGGGAGVTSNIGRVTTSGLEFSASFDAAAGRKLAFRNPWTVSLTYTRARLGNDVRATGNGGAIAESIFSGGREGSELPYIPEYQISIGTAYLRNNWGLHLDAYYQPETFAAADNSGQLVNPDASASAGLQPALDSRYGRIDAFLLLDASLHFRLTDSTQLKLTVTNLFDWAYVSSRVPIGPRPGAPRSFSAGLAVRF